MHTLTTAAVQPTIEVIRGIRDDQLTARTPCSDYDVRALVAHLLQWGPPMVGAAHKEAVPPSQEAPEDWRKALEAQLDALTESWSDPGAWQGVTRMGGPTELPAPMVGGMVLGELVVHGWDLARATGQAPVWSEEVLVPVFEGVEATAEQGREMGVYGAQVPVAPTAPTLDRLLGLTGRDPAWSAA